MRNTIKKQKGTIWSDTQGNKIPLKYIDKGDKLSENHATVLYNEAKKISDALKSFKEKIGAKSDEVFNQKMADKKLTEIKDRKGNFTWSNFDGSIKIETSVSELFSFDDALMTGAKHCFDSFISDQVDDDNPVGIMIREAFTATRKGYDAKKLMNLLKYREKVKNEHFTKALDLLKDAMKVTSTKRYHRVFIRDAEGKYKCVELNFSSI